MKGPQIGLTSLQLGPTRVDQNFSSTLLRGQKPTCGANRAGADGVVLVHDKGLRAVPQDCDKVSGARGSRKKAASVS